MGASKYWGFLLSLTIFLFFPISAQARTYIDNETPIEIQIACNKYGEQYGICAELLESICYQESQYIPTATDATKSCFGLMQIQKNKPQGAHGRTKRK